MNIENFSTYKKARDCMIELNKLSGVYANITTGGLQVKCSEDNKKEVLAIAEKYGGVASYGLTTLEELVIYPIKKTNEDNMKNEF